MRTAMIGTVLGQYRIVGQLGAGGMGVVYHARDERLDRDVAIKVLPAEVADDPSRLARFEREAKALARLSYSNILQIFELGEDRGITFLVTEFLEGATLRELLGQGLLPLRKAVEIAAAIADGLAAAHQAGIVHRDLKPENVFMTKEGRVKVLDFGLAKIDTPPGGEIEGSNLSTAAMTAAGTVLGTVGYMAPEQVRGEPADARSDIFALGCVLYEMVTGRRAFQCDTAAETMTAILRDEPPRVAASGAEAAPELERVLERCLAKGRKQRFQSARDLAFALRGLGGAALRASGRAGAAAGDRPSIAVLPFANLSADPEQEYFCDGMAEEVISALAHVDGLRVIARTSAFAFKGQNVDIREIGAILDVGYLVEGSVRRAGDRLRITAQLIDVGDASHLWSERFDRRLEDVFLIQDEIALAIVDKLKVELLGEERAAIVKRHTTNLDAHNAYLQGVYFWNKLSPDGYARSRRFLEKAISIDPGYAPAYAQLAIWYGSQAFWGALAPREAVPSAFSFAERALTLDERSSDAHTIIGCATAFFERKWQSGERYLRRAAELGPNLGNSHLNLAVVLVVKQEWPEALAEIRAARRLDPLSPPLMTWTSTWLGYAGYLDEGISGLENQIAVHPGHWLPRYALGELMARRDDLGKAREQLEEAVEMSGGAPVALSCLACVCYRAGDRAAGDSALARLAKRAAATYVPAMFLVWAYLAAGDPDAALARAGEAMSAKDGWLAFHPLMSPSFVPADPRVDELLATVLP